jgi:molecular chaperone Hsp33
MGKIYSGMAGEAIRFFIADTTSIAKKAKEIHKTSEVSTIALAKTLTAGSILGRTLKNKQDRLTLKISGNLQIKSILATSGPDGNVKGYISDTDAELPYQSNLSRIGKAIGLGGQVTLIRDFGLKEPYIGLSHMISGEIDDDIAFYYKNSEQQPTWMKMICELEDSEVLLSAGIFVQTMPNVSDKEKELFMKAKEKLGNWGEKLQKGQSLQGLIGEIFEGLATRITGEESVEFYCNCSKERISRALLTVGKDDLEDILEKDGQAEIKCQFCESEYIFNKEDLTTLIGVLDEKNSHK